jgi:hypothetical protein
VAGAGVNAWCHIASSRSAGWKWLLIAVYLSSCPALLHEVDPVGGRGAANAGKVVDHPAHLGYMSGGAAMSPVPAGHDLERRLFRFREPPVPPIPRCDGERIRTS